MIKLFDCAARAILGPAGPRSEGLGPTNLVKMTGERELWMLLQGFLNTLESSEALQPGTKFCLLLDGS